MAYSNNWSSAAPADHSKVKNIPAAIRRAFVDLEERLADLIYGFTAGETDADIGFKILPVKVMDDDPTADANYIGLYAKLVESSAELFAMNGAGNVFQFTYDDMLAGGIIYAATAPAAPFKGQQWYDSTLHVLKLYTGSAWIRLGEQAGVTKTFDGAAADVPDGYLLCYGQAISREDYAELFAAIGTVHGVGDGSLTFNLPDRRGRTIAGYDNMGGTGANVITDAQADTPGGKMGAETVDLAAHNHGVPTTGHSSVDVSTVGKLAVSVPDHAHGITSALNTTSSGSATLATVQPTAFSNVIIKI